jgi:hypothetical protein
LAHFRGSAPRGKSGKSYKRGRRTRTGIPGIPSLILNGRPVSAPLFSFRDGMETLVRALVEALKGFLYVTLRSGMVVRKVTRRTMVVIPSRSAPPFIFVRIADAKIF